MTPLARFRIIELSIGPMSDPATTILADFSADVVKVSPKDGDPFADMGSLALQQAHRASGYAQRGGCGRLARFSKGGSYSGASAMGDATTARCLKNSASPPPKSPL